MNRWGPKSPGPGDEKASGGRADAAMAAVDERLLSLAFHEQDPFSNIDVQRRRAKPLKTLRRKSGGRSAGPKVRWIAERHGRRDNRLGFSARGKVANEMQPIRP